MTRPLLYIAAPYGDPSPTIRAWHTDRAALLGKLAFACGYVPIVVHTSIAAGVYGDDSDPEQRAAGMAATLDVCRAVVAGGGECWALRRDDGSYSDGTRAEVADGINDGRPARGSGWDEWRRLASRNAPALLPEWDRLAVRPSNVGPWKHNSHTHFREYGDGDEDRAAYVGRDGWKVFTMTDINGDWTMVTFGPETGAAGRAAADAALRAMGVLT